MIIVNKGFKSTEAHTMHGVAQSFDQWRLCPC